MIPNSLSELEVIVRRDLHLVEYPHRPWLTSRANAEGHTILDTLIIGAKEKDGGSYYRELHRVR